MLLNIVFLFFVASGLFPVGGCPIGSVVHVTAWFALTVRSVLLCCGFDIISGFSFIDSSSGSSSSTVMYSGLYEYLPSVSLHITSIFLKLCSSPEPLMLFISGKCV